MGQKIINKKSVLVIGGGKYGTKACRFFMEQKAHVFLVDQNSDCQAKEFVAKEDFFLKDAKDAWALALKLKPDFIVPAHPGHTAGKWIREYFHLQPLADALHEVMNRLPRSLILACDIANAALITSYMTRGKLCREDCLPVPERCALTGEPRPAPLYKLLEYAVFGLFDCGKIFAAEQMAAGVGALKMEEILTFIKEVEINKPKTLAVGTACQCHGVLNLFKS
jgi:hypothetical protein